MKWKVLAYVLLLIVVYWDEIRPRVYYYSLISCYNIARVMGQTGIRLEKKYYETIQESYYG